MKDLVGIVAACGLVRLFWDGVMGWAKFYQRHNIDYIVYKKPVWERDREKRDNYERWCRDFGLPVAAHREAV